MNPEAPERIGYGYDVWLDLVRAAERERAAWYAELRARCAGWKSAEMTEAEINARELETLRAVRDYEVAFATRLAAIDDGIRESEKFRPLEEVEAELNEFPWMHGPLAVRSKDLR